MPCETKCACGEKYENGCVCEELRTAVKQSIWSKIESNDFKWFILTNYNWWEIDEDLLKRLVDYHRKAFGLKVKF